MSEERSSRVPMWCPYCRGLMKGNKSNGTWYDWGCCIQCYIEYIEDREQRWKDGWRPSPEVLEAFSKKIAGGMT